MEGDCLGKDSQGEDSQERDSQERDSQERDSQERDSQERDSQSRDSQSRDSQERDSTVIPVEDILDIRDDGQRDVRDVESDFWGEEFGCAPSQEALEFCGVYEGSCLYRAPYNPVSNSSCEALCNQLGAWCLSAFAPDVVHICTIDLDREQNCNIMVRELSVFGALCLCSEVSED